MKKRSRFLQTPIEPFVVEEGLSADAILARMERISFQGRNLATAHRIWQKMLQDDVTIFLGMAGALSAGGLRMVVAHLIRQRYVDVLVSTGANLYHDLHETRGRHHYLGSAHADDAPLAQDQDRADESLAEAKLLGADHGVTVDGATVRARSIGSAIVSHARDVNADLIVLGSSPRWRRQSRFFSPTVDYVLRNAPCEVLIVAFPQSVMDEELAAT